MNDQTTTDDYMLLYGEVSFSAHKQAKYIVALENRVRELEDRLAAEMNLHSAPEPAERPLREPWNN